MFKMALPPARLHTFRTYCIAVQIAANYFPPHHTTTCPLTLFYLTCRYTFTLSTGTFCTGETLPPNTEILVDFYLCISIVVLLLTLSTVNERAFFFLFPAANTCRDF